jgi:beta-glucosidase
VDFIDWSFSDEGIEAWTAGAKGVTYESFDINTGICKTPAGCCADGPSGIRMDSGSLAFSLPIGDNMVGSFACSNCI